MVYLTISEQTSEGQKKASIKRPLAVRGHVRPKPVDGDGGAVDADDPVDAIPHGTNGYSVSTVRYALATLIMNNGNLHVTEAQLGITRATLRQWRNASNRALGIDKSHIPTTDGTRPPQTQLRMDLINQQGHAAIPIPTIVRRSYNSTNPPPTDIAPLDFAALWAGVQTQAIQRLLELIPTATDLRQVALAAAIASDKHLDHRDGRKGAIPTGQRDSQLGDQIILQIIQSRIDASIESEQRQNGVIDLDPATGAPIPRALPNPIYTPDPQTLEGEVLSIPAAPPAASPSGKFSTR